MKKQDGFATLEVVLVTAIISTLAFVAVPKIDRIMDKLFLDYEVKRFCSEVDFASSLNRSASVNTTIFSQKVSESGTGIEINISDEKNSYRLLNNGKNLRESHYLSAGVKISYSPAKMKNIKFKAGGGYNGDSGRVILTSRRGEKAEIIFDSVGRWRGSRDVE